MSDETKIEATAEDNAHVIYIADFVRGIKKFWWICVAFALLLGGIMFFRFYICFVPNYTANATFTVETQISDNSVPGASSYAFHYNKTTAAQLSKTFPLLLKTNLLQEAIKDDLGLEELDVTLSAETVTNSNMFTLTAKGNDAQEVYDVLQSAIKNYPNVARYTVGSIKLTMIEEPVVPTKPTNSNTFIKQTFKGMFVGVFLGAIWILLYALSRKTIRANKDVKNELNQEVIGTVPKIEFKKYSEGVNRSVLFSNPLVDSALNDSICVIRNSILHSLDDSEKVIMVTSTAPGEGKTTVCANLAMSIGSMGKKVLLVDGDIRNPNVNSILDVSTVSDSNDESPYRIDKFDDYGISVLNFNMGQRKLWKIMRIDEFKNIIDSVKDNYDYVFIDTPPSGLISDASVIAQASDAIIYVVFQDVVRVSRIKSSIDGILSSGTRMLGCILNGASSGATGYSSNYGYKSYGYKRYGRYGYGRYGYGYGYGYGERKKKKAEKANKKSIKGMKK